MPTPEQTLELQLTLDGSHTIASAHYGATYHSSHGSLQESLHVFIQHGLLHLIEKSANMPDIKVLELGFGTGLNALLTEKYRDQKQIHYTTIEKHPLPEFIAQQLNYTSGDFFQEFDAFFKSLHSSSWDIEVKINEGFTLHKMICDFDTILSDDSFDLIYHDAFAPSVNPFYWENPFLEALFKTLRPGGVLVTYCAKGSFKRALKAAGFKVEELQGPPGKREMTRASKD